MLVTSLWYVHEVICVYLDVHMLFGLPRTMMKQDRRAKRIILPNSLVCVDQTWQLHC